MNVQQVDSILALSSRLEEALNQAEAGSLAADAWDDLFDDECALEEELMNQSTAFYAIGNFRAASQLWTTVGDFNERLVSIIQFIIDSQPTDSADREELGQTQLNCMGTATVARAEALRLSAIDQRLSGSPSEAAASAEEARQLYELVTRNSEGKLSERVSFLALIAEAIRLAAVADGQRFLFQYDDGAITYLQAKKVLETARTRLLQSDDIDTTMLATVMADMSAFEMSSENMLLLKALAGGKFGEALRHAETIVKNIESQDNPGLPTFYHQSAQRTRCSAEAYIAYVRAELATDNRNWDDAQRLLATAEDQWRQEVAVVIDLDIPQSRQIAEFIQVVSAQFVGSCRRRIERERSLCAQIAELRADNLQLQSKIFQLAGKTTFGGDYMPGDKYNISKVGQAASIGSHNTLDDTHMNQTNVENVLSDVDMTLLAEQLRVLIAKLKEEASDPDQYSALSEVSYAAQAANEQDRTSTLQHLRKAGEWVLGIATNVGIPVAVTALKRALGLP